jgi:hypothetical protein
MESPYIIFLLLTSLFFMTRSFSEGLFGDLTKVIDSDMNPKWLQLINTKIHMACGDKDILLYLPCLKQNTVLIGKVK